MKNIVIVGASRGIGKELVKQLSANHNVLAFSRNKERLLALSKETGAKVQDIDLTSELFKTEFTESITNHFKTVDVLINNAGYLVNKPFLETTLEDIKKTFETNVFGLIQSSQAIIPFMESNGGHIVNIGSIGGVQGSVKFPGIGVYSSSKAAVTGYTECLAEELKETNIQVNSLALGAVQTEMLAEAFPGYEAPTSPEEMAEFIANFSLNSNKWMHGKIIPVSKSTP
ncbi:MAG: short-chain dehydrogenase [Crocinitomix sp. MedPE-SWsnd]|nr:MAG: short-chain dehydrogenase [Crocinitomix sp. MedPE-SWsnd]